MKKALFLSALLSWSCGQTTKTEYVYVPAPSGGATSDAGGSSGVGGQGGGQGFGAGPGGWAQGGSTQGGHATGGQATGGSGHGGAEAGESPGGSAGAAGESGIGADDSGVCPSVAPAVGGDCPEEGRICTWGDSGLPECRTFLVCTAGQWEKGSLPGVVGAEEGIGSECHEPPEGACPATSPAGTSCPAELDRTRCQYSDGTLCACLINYCNDDVCSPLPGPEWLCNRILPPCPGAVPNAGTPCTGPEGSCTYDYSSLAAQCLDGIWEWQLFWE